VKEVTREGINPLFFYQIIMSYFTQTSDGPYDRHKYKLIFKNRKAIIFDDWETLRNTWFNMSGMKQLHRVEVLDK
tara:strand:- start:331 stop:555 length:225 start_codon:yes stop_codon:yes gene_type:complete